MASYVKDYVMDPSDAAHLFVNEELAGTNEEKSLARSYNNEKASEIGADAFCAFGELAKLLMQLEAFHKMRTNESIGYVKKLKELGVMMNNNILR
jgi:hypothetical protein